MPLLETFASGNAQIGLWQITETEEELLQLTHSEQIAQEVGQFKSGLRRCEFLASRLLVLQMLQKAYLPSALLRKDAFGKPFLHESPHSLSLSHTTGMAAAILSEAPATGLDLEPVKPAILRIKQKFLSSAEQENVQENAQLATLYWSIKETIYKLHGKRKLLFKEHMLVQPFTPNSKGGTAFATLIADGQEITYPVQYQIRDELVLTWCNAPENTPTNTYLQNPEP